MTAVRVTQTGVLRAEWIKLRSLRSTLLTALFAAGAMLLMGVVGATDFGSDWDAATAVERASLDPTQTMLSGWFLAQVLIGVIGALAVTSEYASGSIAATLAAVPRRTPVLVAKLLVPAPLALLTMVPATVLALLVGRTLLPDGVTVDLADGELLKAVLGIGIAMAGVCAIGACLGFLVRSTAGAIGILVVVLLVLPMLAGGVSPELARLLPSGAIESLVTADVDARDHPPLAWPVGLALLAGYVAVAAGVATVVLRRRDA
jgi:ABC-2 type transport system permease protein